MRKKGQKGHIIAKMNSLCDRDIIAALYAASQAGVKIELIVRGICCLKTGIPGISENISVHSIVGDFLEHARIFYFYSNGQEEIYMGSADWMPRNLDKRVEIIFPVEDERLKEEIKHILDIQLSDNTKAHLLQPDGTYVKPDEEKRWCALRNTSVRKQSKGVRNRRKTDSIEYLCLRSMNQRSDILLDIQIIFVEKKERVGVVIGFSLLFYIKNNKKQ